MSFETQPSEYGEKTSRNRQKHDSHIKIMVMMIFVLFISRKLTTSTIWSYLYPSKVRDYGRTVHKVFIIIMRFRNRASIVNEFNTKHTQPSFTRFDPQDIHTASKTEKKRFLGSLKCLS